jgi:hypothetical protein
MARISRATRALPERMKGSALSCARPSTVTRESAYSVSTGAYDGFRRRKYERERNEEIGAK